MYIRYYILYFIILSFAGYIYETIAMTLWGGKFENRGFVFGPVIPIYGAGAVIGTMLLTFHYYSLNGIYVFLIGMVASAILEYPTHIILEKIFHKTWWDYSKAPLNLHGRISLFSSAGFGIAALLIVKVINPALIPLITSIPENLAFILAACFGGIFGIDFLLTIICLKLGGHTKLNKIDEQVDAKIESVVNPLLNEDKKLSKYFYSAVDKIEEKTKDLLE